ncbi:class I SAM-dependent methyltransferase [Candidatus Gottesmanbacteria bacterium]|nr:class I SAM-dependent methyltransferase [Candidatus Gottesmanbacteria bacterium]
MNANKLAVSTYKKIANKYTDLYFNDQTDLPQINKFLVELKPKAKILDVGSGPGEYAKYLLDKGFEVEGIDLSSAMLRIAKKKVPNGKFSRMDLRSLLYPAETFNALLVAYSIIHIPSAEIPKTLMGFNRVLKSGGLVFLITQKGKPDQTVDEPLKEGEKMFFNFFTKKRIAKFLTDNGFTVVRQEEIPSSDIVSMSSATIYTLAKVIK